MGDIATVDETIKRLAAHRGVKGVVVATAEGVPIRSTLDNDAAQQHAALATMLSIRAKSAVKELDPDDELQFLRIRGRKGEILVAPGGGADRPFCLVVVQGTSSE